MLTTTVRALALALSLAGATAAPATATATAPAPARVGVLTNITTVESDYGTDPQQHLIMRRDLERSGPRPLVLFIHGGGWRSGDLASLEDEARAWAEAGWVTVNMNYRTGDLDGVTGDGRRMVADVDTVLQRFRGKFYVDPARIIVYGASAGGHLAAWLGTYRGSQVAGTIVLSPTSNIPGAIAEGQRDGAPTNVRNLGASAAEFWTYSTSARPETWAGRVRAGRGFLIVVSRDEWVDPDVHGRKLCAVLTARCELWVVDGEAHAGGIVDARPEMAGELEGWASARVNGL